MFGLNCQMSPLLFRHVDDARALVDRDAAGRPELPGVGAGAVQQAERFAALGVDPDPRSRAACEFAFSSGPPTLPGGESPY